MLINTNINKLFNAGISTNMFQSNHKLLSMIAICLLGMSSSAYAATESEGADYVDSVYGWGAWELGLEPAAGGPPPSPGRALAAMEANVQFRPNENSAFSPDTRPVQIPAAPVGPTGILAPGTSLPTGNPADLWFK